MSQKKMWCVFQCKKKSKTKSLLVTVYKNHWKAGMPFIDGSCNTEGKFSPFRPKNLPLMSPWAEGDASHTFQCGREEKTRRLLEHVMFSGEAIRADNLPVCLFLESHLEMHLMGWNVFSPQLRQNPNKIKLFKVKEYNKLGNISSP